MKTIYLIRHGESEGNIGPKYQDASYPLTEKGNKQAETIADRAVNLDFETLIASTMVRAQETAKAISKKTGKEIESSDLFIESRRPSEQLNQRYDDPKAMEARDAIFENFKKPGYRFSDEENFDDIKVRAFEALDFLKDRSEDNILVVSHGKFIRIIIATIIMGENLSARECDGFIKRLWAGNVSISVIKLMDNGTWEVIVVNDQSHLG